MPRQLTITPTPYKSSYLSIPPTPFSPRLPITPPASPPKLHHTTTSSRAAKLKASAELLPPPPESLHWLWQCHKCNRVYQLGVTRRCLDDGHFFCAGTTVVKGKGSGRKVKRHAACASEFDYQGWKAWGVCRRSVVERIEAAEALMRAEEAFEMGIEEAGWLKGRWMTGEKKGKGKDCWMKCDYPSECRWGKQFGVHQTVVPSTPAAPKKKKEEVRTSFEEILELIAPTSPASGDIADAQAVEMLEPLSPTKSSDQKAVIEAETKSVSMNDLLESAKRRKRRSSGQLPSPLGANPPEAEVIVQKASDDLELELKRRSWDKDLFVEGLNVVKKRV